MLKQTIALLAPVALIVTATGCGGTSSFTPGEDEQGTPHADGVADEQVESTESAIRGGAVRGGGFVAGARGGAIRWGGAVGGARVAGVRRGWVGGRWAPGWGWAHGVWIVGGGAQYTCVSNVDCVGPLGPGVAVCSYDPTLALGYCVAPNW